MPKAARLPGATVGLLSASRVEYAFAALTRMTSPWRAGKAILGVVLLPLFETAAKSRILELRALRMASLMSPLSYLKPRDIEMRSTSQTLVACPMAWRGQFRVRQRILYTYRGYTRGTHLARGKANAGNIYPSQRCDTVKKCSNMGTMGDLVFAVWECLLHVRATITKFHNVSKCFVLPYLSVKIGMLGIDSGI